MENLDYVAVGKKIKNIRVQKNYSQQNLADITNLSTNYISEIELGKKEGRLDTYYRIAVALNVSLDEFVIDSIPADTIIFENNFNALYKNFGKTRKDMLLNFMNYLDSKKEYDCEDGENI